MRKETVLRTLAVLAILLTLTGPLSLVQGPQEKTIIFGREGGWAQWDPSENYDVTSVALLNIYEPLLYVSPPGSPEFFTPALATSWEVSEDAMTWDFYLREGVKFHDGNAFNAETAKFSIERTIEMNAGPAYIWWAVDTVEAVDTYHLRINLSAPFPIDLVASAGYGAHMMSPNPDYTTEWYSEGNAVGTGPYKLDSWGGIAGDTVLVKNPDWWGSPEPYFDRVILRPIPEATTQELQLLSGDIHITEHLPLEDVEILEQNPDLVIHRNPTFQNLFGMLNNKKFPTNITEVRQALSYATPYEDIIDALLGFAIQSRGVIPHGMWGHSDEVFQYPYDPEKADELLTAAGFPLVNGKRDGFPTITATTNQGDELQEKTMNLMASTFADLGITLDVTPELWDTRWALARDPETAPHMFAYYWWPSYLDPNDYLYAQFHSPDPEYGVVFELAHYENPVFDKLIEDAGPLSATDKDAALAKYIAAQNILVEDAASIFFYDIIEVVGHRAEIKGYVDNPTYAGDAVFFKFLYIEEVVAEFGDLELVIGLFTVICFVTLVELRKKRQ